ncbi:MAG: NAD(P)-binding protein [Mycobacteriaceae bacterium]
MSNHLHLPVQGSFLGSLNDTSGAKFSPSRRQVLSGVGVAAMAGAVSTLLGPGTSAAVPQKKGRRVAIFGGGPGGMATAQELLERGFEVQLFERHTRLGGKIRSEPIPGTAGGGREGLPIEPGAHALYGAYRHFNPMMERVPVGGGRSVSDNTIGFEPLLSPSNLNVLQSFVRAFEPGHGLFPGDPRTINGLIPTLLHQDLTLAEAQWLAEN